MLVKASAFRALGLVFEDVGDEGFVFFLFFFFFVGGGGVLPTISGFWAEVSGDANLVVDV